MAVFDDTRRLRRMLAKDRATILFATIGHHAERWWVSLNVAAADLHPAHTHPIPDRADDRGWVGVDRGLSAFLVAATVDGTEVARIADAPKALAAGMKRQQRLAKSLSRKQKGSHHRREAAATLARHHHHVADVRRHFLHQVSNALVKTHDRLVLENLNISGMLANHRLARAISDAGWPSSPGCWLQTALVRRHADDRRSVVSVKQTVPSCGAIRGDITLADRVFTCGCGIPPTETPTRQSIWPAGTGPSRSTSRPRTPKQAGRPPTLADGTALTSTPRVPVKPAR